MCLWYTDSRNFQISSRAPLPGGGPARHSELSGELGIRGPRSGPGSITQKPHDVGQAQPLSLCSLPVLKVLPSSHISITGKTQCLLALFNLYLPQEFGLTQCFPKCRERRWKMDIFLPCEAKGICRQVMLPF